MGNELTLANIGGGAAVEKFGEELERVIENMLDPNTNPMAPRKIMLEVCFKPDRDRSFGVVTVSTLAKLAPSVGYATRAYFGKDNNRCVAYEDNPKQITLQDFVDAKSAVPTITPTEKKAVSK